MNDTYTQLTTLGDRLDSAYINADGDKMDEEVAKSWADIKNWSLAVFPDGIKGTILSQHGLEEFDFEEMTTVKHQHIKYLISVFYPKNKA